MEMEQFDLTWPTKVGTAPKSPNSGGVKQEQGKENLQYAPLFIQNNGTGFDLGLNNLVSPPITPADYFKNQFQSSPGMQFSIPSAGAQDIPFSAGTHDLQYSAGIQDMQYSANSQDLGSLPYQNNFNGQMNYMIPQELEMAGADLYHIPEHQNEDQFEWMDMQPENLMLPMMPQTQLNVARMNQLNRINMQMKTSNSASSLNSWSTNTSFQSQDWRNPQENVFHCTFPGCTKSFNKQSNLKSHARIHVTERNFACEDCGACFRRSHDLKRHHRSLHSDVKPFGCSRCGKRFSRMDALKRHTSRETSACFLASEQLEGEK